jgi:hypothetical protein
MCASQNGIQFHRKAVRTESRLMIQSTCASCGIAKLVSHHDRSLEEWEAQHECKSKAKATNGRAS